MSPAQHCHKTSLNATLSTAKSTSPSFLVQTRLKSTGRPSFPHKPDWFTSVLDPAVEHGLHSLTYLQTSSHRSARDLSDPFVKDRQTFHQACPDTVRHIEAHRKMSQEPYGCHCMSKTSWHQHNHPREQLTSSFFGASRSVSAAQRQNYHHRRCFINVYHAKDFQSNRPFKEKNMGSSHHHTILCPNFSSPTQKHTAHIKFLWCLTVRQRRSTAKLSSSPLFHQRVPRKRFSVLQTFQRKKTRVPLSTTQYSAQTSVHQHKSTRLTSSFFGASRSVSAAQRQNYHHRRCFINVYHAKDLQSNRPFKEKNTGSPHHHTILCPNFSSPTQKHTAHIKFLWCLTVRQRRSTAKLSSSPLFHQRVPRKRFSV